MPELLNRKKSKILLFLKIFISLIYTFEPVLFNDKDLFVSPYILFLICN